MSKGMVRKSSILFKDETGEEWFVGKEIVDDYNNPTKTSFEAISIFEGINNIIITLQNIVTKKYKYLHFKR